MAKKTLAQQVMATNPEAGNAPADKRIVKIVVTPEDHRALKVAAAFAGRSVRDFGGRVIRDALAKMPKEPMARSVLTERVSPPQEEVK